MRVILLISFWFSVFSILPYSTFSQVFDDFSDGDFTNNPVWSGDDAQFEVNTSFQLHLKSTGAATYYLGTANSRINNTEWRFWVKLSFNTSDNNNARFYLVSDQTNLTGTLNGYFVQVGGTPDNIQLCKQTGSNVTTLINGSVAYTGNSVNQLRIKVIRDNSGNWSLYSDPAGGNDFQSEGTAFDNTYTATSFVGVWCKFTSSNATKFYFDDIYAGDIVVDTIPPFIKSVVIVNQSQLDVVFSEAVKKDVAETSSNYFISNGIGTPVSVQRDAADPSLVHIALPAALTSPNTYQITINQIADLNGNISSQLSQIFTYYVAQAFDVLINEIMADPDPQVGLPPVEYIELYNRSAYAVSLSGWSMLRGTTLMTFPSYSIPSNGYVILAKADVAGMLAPFGDVISFSSFSVTNTGQTLTLKNSTGAVIHSVSFADTWYQSTSKKDGGWSLELIDPLNPCAGNENWKASVSPLGGTPGSINSVTASNPDNISPYIAFTAVPNPWQLQVIFSESMDSLSLLQLTNFSIDKGLGNPTASKPMAPDYCSTILTLSQPVVNGEIYTISFTNNLKDCAGNLMQANIKARFALPDSLKPGDVAINEVLFNPNAGGVDYVEIYNKSPKVLDLSQLSLSSWDTITQTPVSVNSLSSYPLLLFPRDYLLLSTDAKTVKKQYQTHCPSCFLDLSGFPSFNNTSGTVVLLSKALQVIDRFDYNESMHFPLIQSVKGVSLEKINPGFETQDASNWHSASSLVGYGTPGYQNSQFTNFKEPTGELSVDPEIFSPDNDGYQDILSISYQLSEPGFTGSITIYNASGQIVRYLVKNEILGTHGTYVWDGINESRLKASVGIFIIVLEAFNNKGQVKKLKTTAVLGGKL